MSFVTLTFIIFLVVVFILYFVVPKKGQWIVLLGSSYFFYVYASPLMALFMAFTTVTTFFTGKAVGNVNNKYQSFLIGHKGSLNREEKKDLKHQATRRKRLIITIALLANFGILAFLKYYNFIALNLNGMLNVLALDAEIPILDLLLPLGISFYTFQSAGYIFDVYRGKYEPDQNLAKFALFVSFFPQIVQGPISRYDQLAHQLYEPHKFDYQQFKFGLLRIGWGYFKKLVIADRAAILVNQIVGSYMDYAGFEIGFGILVFVLQIYADFSGGMDIVIGIGQCMGIKVTENFMRPHFATSVSDYWRRWHITLGAWMKDYVFYPLSLSKPFTKLGRKCRKFMGNYLGKIFPTCLAMLLVFLLVGIWHGPSWKYIAFGLYNGFWIIMGIIFTPLLVKANTKLKINTKSFAWKVLLILATFFLVCISKTFAVAPSLSVALEMLKSAFTVFNPWVLFDGSLYQLGLNRANIALLGIATLILFCVSLAQERGIHVRETLEKQNIGFRWLIYFALVFSIIIFGTYGVGYDASSFIYMAF